MSFKNLIDPYITWQNYFNKPTFVATILFLLAAFKVPIIFLLIYVVFVYIDNAEDDEYEIEITGSFDYKKKDNSIGSVDIKLPVPTEPIKKEYAYELLFRSRDSRIIKAFTPQEAIENGRLTPEEKADFVGVEQL